MTGSLRRLGLLLYMERGRAMAKKSTGYSKKDLEHFRKLLIEQLHERTGDIEGLELEETEGERGGGGRDVGDMADMGNQLAQTDLLRDLEENERQEVREILEALERVENGTYGVCERSGELIPKARLEFIPWTRYTIDAAREAEEEEAARRR